MHAHIISILGFWLGTSGQSLDCDLGQLDEAALELAAFRLPRDKDVYVELELTGGSTGEKTRLLVSDVSGSWKISADRSGSWRWELVSGDATLSYAPTARRQPLYDGAVHRLGFSLHPERKEARLYFDGSNVAIYSVDGGSVSAKPGLVIGDGLGERGRRLRIDTEPLSGMEIFGPTGETPNVLRVLAWNIWHGGRENGDRLGVQQVIDVIRDSQADIVCMQETYGSGPEIADALGFYFFLRSSNLSIMSRFPIGETIDLYQPFRFGGAEIHAGDLALNVFSLWIHYLPSVREQLEQESCTPDSLIAAEWETRASEMRDILEELRPQLADTDRRTLLVAGDFNSASHLDWTMETAGRPFHRGHVVRWPVSDLCVGAGLIDGFRTVHSNPEMHPGVTWSPRFGYTHRIDYVYHKGPRLIPRLARVIDSHAARFPSDHAAVLVEYEVR